MVLKICQVLEKKVSDKTKLELRHNSRELNQITSVKGIKVFIGLSKFYRETIPKETNQP